MDKRGLLKNGNASNPGSQHDMRLREDGGSGDYSESEVSLESDVEGTSPVSELNMEDLGQLRSKYELLEKRTALRKHSVEHVSLVTVFFAGFAINDFARFDPTTFQREWLCSLYVCLMSYTVCHIFLTTILGMCIAVILATLQQHDEAHKAEFFSSPSTWKRNARSNHDYQEALEMVGLKNKKRHLGRELAEGVFLPTAYHFMMHTCDFAGAGP
eukprot:CAMPEP_0119512836 /NCGR_PEP_ID=MMETSP1344-20130328/31111_1 /TAXON_ID=236787 /ORGANISM="Florenciella parvula, Strain CCMP2471" /LENGTH=213 /DNA_ID=CAMNT_0007549997 /DNA_START=299 /DNA_END=937 /DNA_ORIENTATION=+